MKYLLEYQDYKEFHTIEPLLKDIAESADKIKWDIKPMVKHLKQFRIPKEWQKDFDPDNDRNIIASELKAKVPIKNYQVNINNKKQEYVNVEITAFFEFVKNKRDIKYVKIYTIKVEDNEMFQLFDKTGNQLKNKYIKVIDNKLFNLLNKKLNNTLFKLFNRKSMNTLTEALTIDNDTKELLNKAIDKHPKLFKKILKNKNTLVTTKDDIDYSRQYWGDNNKCETNTFDYIKQQLEYNQKDYCPVGGFVFVNDSLFPVEHWWVYNKKTKEVFEITSGLRLDAKLYVGVINYDINDEILAAKKYYDIRFFKGGHVGHKYF